MGLIYNEETARFKQSLINFESKSVNNDNTIIDNISLSSPYISLGYEGQFTPNPVDTEVSYTFTSDMIAKYLQFDFGHFFDSTGINLTQKIEVYYNNSLIDTILLPAKGQQFNNITGIVYLDNQQIKKNDIIKFRTKIALAAPRYCVISYKYHGILQ